tara:strand:+ start:104 stop:448 length:345 start_codon:yes stop_codon:yes gene_type:complete
MKKFSTYFVDVDGTIFKYRKFETYETSEAEPIQSTVDFLNGKKKEGHMIILTTARPNELEDHTLLELRKHNIPFDRLVMGIERGPRYVINDMDPNNPGKRAFAINLERNKGIDE